MWAIRGGVAANRSAGGKDRVGLRRRAKAPPRGDDVATIDDDRRLEHVEDANHTFGPIPLTGNSAHAGGEVGGNCKSDTAKRQGLGRDEGGLARPQDELIRVENNGDDGAGDRRGDEAAAAGAIRDEDVPAIAKEQREATAGLGPTIWPSRPFWTISSSSRGCIRSGPDK
jgi:hypothetical protein